MAGRCLLNCSLRSGMDSLGSGIIQASDLPDPSTEAGEFLSDLSSCRFPFILQNHSPPMVLLSLLPKLLIAGGSSFLGTLQIPSPEVINNHTLLGEKIPSTQVVCRDRWGTPMLPDGKAGYSVIAPIKKSLIVQSLWIPPIHGERPVKAAAPAEAVLTPASSEKAVPAAGAPPATTSATVH